ncbi:nitrite reductase small subunit NirD [Xanthomonas sp. AmX2]|uniref:nitrite reductase small subunit NirD n=1 Tax=Xanthomonas sp. TaxID=29446 RepID=UPI00197EE754|nr:nitrite reductase small subunit NirD [Xanthomonas sp.]MBN6150991.1 nitrite reductase small subunit NirD [Xanthomonas sp.]
MSVAPDWIAPAWITQDWIRICRLDEIPALGARVLELDGSAPIAVFRTAGDRVFALVDRCPHKGGPLSQGIVAGDSVTCPLHNWNIALDSGQACAPDVGCARRFPVRVDDGEVWLSLPGAG